MKPDTALHGYQLCSYCTELDIQYAKHITAVSDAWRVLLHVPWR